MYRAKYSQRAVQSVPKYIAVLFRLTPRWYDHVIKQQQPTLCLPRKYRINKTVDKISFMEQKKNTQNSENYTSCVVRKLQTLSGL